MKHSSPDESDTGVGSDRPLAVPIRRAFKLIGVSVPKGYELIHRGQLRSFLIDSRRYARLEDVNTFLAQRIAETRDSVEKRAQKVRAATKASLRSRALTAGA